MVINMNSVYGSDTLVVRTCAQIKSLLTCFDTDCKLVESAEFRHEEVPGAEEARSREQSIIDQWQSGLQQIGQLTAHTNFGALAKILVIQCCVEHGLAADENVVVLVQSLARDLDKIMRRDAGCSCRLRPLSLPAGLACD